MRDIIKLCFTAYNVLLMHKENHAFLLAITLA